MSDVWFVKTRYQDIGYVPYQDWFKLAELSGYPTCYLDEMDVDDPTKTYIITPLNGEWEQGWQNPRARLIHAELEWRVDWRAEADTPPGISEVWAFEPSYARSIGAKFVLLGSHPDFAKWDNPGGLRNASPMTYDVAFMSYLDPPRRRAIVNELQVARVSIAPNGWGVERWRGLTASRLMLAPHQWDNLPYYAPLRLAIAASYSIPVISEQVIDRAPFNNGHFLLCAYEYLVPFTRHWLRSENANFLADVGRALHTFLCETNPFRTCIEAAL